METYHSFEEKDVFFKFGGNKIDNESDFIKCTNLLFAQDSRNTYIFRGMPEAKFKIFNTAQRAWFEISDTVDFSDEEKYDNFIVKLLTECKKWNSGTVPNLLKTYEVNEKNSISYLSFMQHFGLPTPFVDFTKNANNALYFAVESLPYDYRESENEIDNYFSIYYNFQDNTFFEGFNEIFNLNRGNKNSGEFDYQDLTKNGIILITDEIKEFKILNNIRIANQEGLFLYNNSPNLSLEEQYKLLSDMYLDKFGDTIFEKLSATKTFSGCLNIHKKFVKRIKDTLTEMNITKGFIYPEIEDLKDKMLKICT
jgi:hypothetical protein